MNYAKIENTTIVLYPYGFIEFQEDNKYTNYSNDVNFVQIFSETDVGKQGFTLEPVVVVDQPKITYQQTIAEGTPIFVNDAWMQTWIISELTTDQLTASTASQSQIVRFQRDSKLAQCDWTQVADSPVDKAIWAVYRQELRDITKADGFPWTMVWPTQP